jgi:hypothetical protein
MARKRIFGRITLVSLRSPMTGPRSKRAGTGILRRAAGLGDATEASLQRSFIEIVTQPNAGASMQN